MNEEEMTNQGVERLHLWWELSYAQYLTIPRSVMQSMPDDWQDKMAALLEKLDETIDWRPKNGCYYCFIRLDNGRFSNDQLANYQRGSRRIPHKKPMEGRR